jgi:hypothetical protein
MAGEPSSGVGKRGSYPTGHAVWGVLGRMVGATPDDARSTTAVLLQDEKVNVRAYGSAVEKLVQNATPVPVGSLRNAVMRAIILTPETAYRTSNALSLQKKAQLSDDDVCDHFACWQKRGWVTLAKERAKADEDRKSSRAQRKYTLSRSARLALFGKCREMWHVQATLDAASMLESSTFNSRETASGPQVHLLLDRLAESIGTTELTLDWDPDEPQPPEPVEPVPEAAPEEKPPDENADVDMGGDDEADKGRDVFKTTGVNTHLEMTKDLAKLTGLNWTFEARHQGSGRLLDLIGMRDPKAYQQTYLWDPVDPFVDADTNSVRNRFR